MKNIIYVLYYYNLIIIKGILSICNFMYNTLMNTDTFNILVTTYIGISALIVSLAIFAMDKGNMDKRNIFKVTLVEESNIKQLIKETMCVFFIILIQIILPFNLFRFIFRVLIVILTIKITIMIGKSFKRVIDIIVNEEEKQKYVNKLLVNSIKKVNSKNIQLSEKIDTAKMNFNKIFSRECYISYNKEYIFDFSNEYKYIFSKEEGIIKKIDLEKLKLINLRIKNYILNNRKQAKEDFFNDSFFIITKMEGERVKKNEIIIYIRKELEDLNISYEDFIQIVEEDRKEEKIIENQIIDVCQMYVDNINQNNIYGMNQSKKDICLLYETLIKNDATYFLNTLSHSILELYRTYNTIIAKKSLIDIVYTLACISQENDIFDDFKNYYSVYFYLRIDGLDNDEVYNMFNSFNIMTSIILKNNKILEKEKFIDYILCMKQKLLKELVDNKKYGQVLEKIERERDLTLYKLNRHMNNYLNYEEYPNRYRNLDIEIVKQQEMKLYQEEFEKINNNVIISINIAEWARYRYDMYKEDSKELINEIIDTFENYNIDDVIELYMENRNEKSSLIKETMFWELSEENNRHKCISPRFNMYNIIYLIILNARESNMRKIKFKKYISKENKNIFESLKFNIENISQNNLEIINITTEEYNEKKQKICQYLQQIINLCKEEENKQLEDFVFDVESKKIFQKAVLEEMEKNKEKSKIISLFKQLDKIKYSEKYGKSLDGFTINYDKIYFLDNKEAEAKSIAKQITQGLIEEQEKKLLKEISKTSIYTEESIKSIIDKFNNKKDIIILTPYITEEFNIYDEEKKQYLYAYENDKEKIDIPVLEHMGYKDEIIIGDKESFGSVEYYKIDRNKHKEIEAEDLVNEYTIANLKDLSEIKGKNKGEEDNIYDKMNMKLYQNIRYVKSNVKSLYKKKLRN